MLVRVSPREHSVRLSSWNAIQVGSVAANRRVAITPSVAVTPDALSDFERRRDNVRVEECHKEPRPSWVLCQSVETCTTVLFDFTSAYSFSGRRWYIAGVDMVWTWCGRGVVYINGMLGRCGTKRRQSGSQPISRTDAEQGSSITVVLGVFSTVETRWGGVSHPDIFKFMV